MAIGHVIEKLEQIAGYQARIAVRCKAKLAKAYGSCGREAAGAAGDLCTDRSTATTFVILVVGPEAQTNRVGFDQAVFDAQQRFNELEL